jgi:3-hydroxyacyl-CoA dehydrogenase
MDIRKVGVLGCGLMGSGIAQVAAMAGFEVTVLKVEQKLLDKGFTGLEKSLTKFAERPIEKGAITCRCGGNASASSACQREGTALGL